MSYTGAYMHHSASIGWAAFHYILEIYIHFDVFSLLFSFTFAVSRIHRHIIPPWVLTTAPCLREDWVPLCVSVRTSQPEPHFNIKPVFPGMGISIMKVRLTWDRLIFIIGIAMLVRRHLFIETAPRGTYGAFSIQSRPSRNRAYRGVGYLSLVC